MTTTATPARLRPTTWRNAVFAIFATNGLGIAAIISRAPTLRDQLHISVAGMGVLIFAASLASIVGLLLSSHVVHALGGRRTIAVMLAGCGVGVAGVGLGAQLHSYAIAWAALFVFGFSSSICDVAMNVEGGGVERATGTAIMPWFHAAWSVGTVVSAGLGSAAAFADVPPLVHLVVIGAVMVVGGVVATRFVPAVDAPAADDAPASKMGFRERMSVWLEPRTLLIGLIMLGTAFAEGSANDWVSLSVVDGWATSDAIGALGLWLFVAAMTGMRFVATALLDRFGRVSVLRLCAVLSIVGLLVFGLAGPLPVALAGVLVWGAGAAVGFPVGMSAASDDPLHAAQRVAVVSTIGYAAFLAGPPVLGFLAQHLGYRHALLTICVPVLLGLLVVRAAAPLREESVTKN